MSKAKQLSLFDDRYPNGQFRPGNKWRFQPGDERTIRLAKKGFAAMTRKTFNGHKGKAMEWLGLCLLREKGMLDW